MQGVKRSLASKILEFMGRGILQDVQRKPQWWENVEATRATLACRHERVRA